MSSPRAVLPDAAKTTLLRIRRERSLMLRSTAQAVRLEAWGQSHALRLGGGFGVGLALLARHGLFRIVARRALGDAGGGEEARHAVGRLRALGEPGLHL